MGVSGCGKTSVGQALSAACEMRFIDGDDLHPERNIQKMSKGQPLDDDDRRPWLVEVGRTLATIERSTVIGCSALKKKYRDLIRSEAVEAVHFIHLDASKDVLAERHAQRKGHFMPPSLLNSQFEALEPLDPDELGIRIDIERPFSEVVGKAEMYVRETTA
ncbi:MAG: gluconokinase [Pseudomonadota bacterium]